jgi:hypothetical protein
LWIILDWLEEAQQVAEHLSRSNGPEDAGKGEGEGLLADKAHEIADDAEGPRNRLSEG